MAVFRNRGRARNPVDDGLTPEQREARIAELRALRRVRMRRLAIRSAIGSVALLALVAIALYWLLQTVAGRDVLLNQIIARLPAGSSFTWKKVEGPLAGPLTLHGVDFRYQKIHFTAERIYLDPDLRPLLGRRLRLDALELTHATLDVPGSDEPFKLPTWPELLPQIEMPIAIQADTLAIDGLRITRSTQPLIDIRRAHGGIDIGDGYFKAEKLALDTDRGRIDLQGGYEPRSRYRTDFVATAVFPATLGRSPARIGLVARGDRSSMDAALAGNAPAPIRVMLGVRGEENPTWVFSGKSEALDLSLLGIGEKGEPLAFDLNADGAGGAANLRGRVAQGDFTAVLDPSRIRIANEVLTVEPLAVRAFDGLTTVRGRADFRDPENPVFKFSVNARGLRWGEDVKTQIAGGRGPGFRRPDEGLGGHRQGDAGAREADRDRGLRRAWRRRATGFEQVAGKDADRHPGRDRHGRLGAATTLGPGRATGRVRSRLFPRRLEGRCLRQPGQQRPGTRGRRLRRHAGYSDNSAAACVGASWMDAAGSPCTATRAKASSHLRSATAASTPRARSATSSTWTRPCNRCTWTTCCRTPSAASPAPLKLTGARNAPNVDADLSGSGLKWSGYGADTLSVRGRLPWRGSNGELAIRASAVDVGMVLDSLRVDARGAVEDLRFDGDASNAMGSVSLAGTALKRGANWQGSLDTLQLTPSKGSDWRLQQPARYAQNGAAFTLSPACLAASGGGALCAEANWPRQGLQLHADALPLTLVQPWLPPSNGRPLTLRGEIKLDASVKPAGNAWVGEVHLASLDGGLKLGNNSRGEIVRYDNFTLDADFNPQSIKGRLGTGFKGDGYVDATIATGWDAFSPLKGDIYFNNSRLFWLELFSPDLVRPTGDLHGHVGLAGTRGTPALSGEAQLTQFKGELPSLGITLTEGVANLVAQADGSARIDGTLASVSSTGGAVNGGTLSVDGTLDWKVEGSPLQFNIRGKDFLVADTTDLQAVASPDLKVQFADNTIQVRGQVVVPSASIDVEKLDDGVSVSEDVVVLDPVDPERTPGSRLDLDMAITLGDAVKLKGYGLDGSLGRNHERAFAHRSRDGRQRSPRRRWPLYRVWAEAADHPR